MQGALICGLLLLIKPYKAALSQCSRTHGQCLRSRQEALSKNEVLPPVTERNVQMRANVFKDSFISALLQLRHVYRTLVNAELWLRLQHRDATLGRG